MRVFAVVVMACLALPAFAEENAHEGKARFCEDLQGALAYNAILESVCGFEWGLSKKLDDMSVRSGCVPAPSSLVEEVLVDTKYRYQVMGHDTFCGQNEIVYIDLLEVLQPSTP